MNAVFTSVLKEEMASFMEFIKPSLVDSRRYQHTLSELDAFLHAQGLAEKKLEGQLLGRWLDGFKVHLLTKKGRLSRVKRFSTYLSTLGIAASLPELPRGCSEFKPYVFSRDEMALIFETADDFMLAASGSRLAAEFPVLLRILYGCGLRLGEAEALAWDDIDLAAGVITVKAAKNQKQRLVPMGDELARILGLYKKASCLGAQAGGFLFAKDNGQRRSKGAHWYIFNRILTELGIKNPQNTRYGSRGPCIHSLRHTFTLHSLLKAESEGRGFMETVPFLSTYLGHEGLMETDKYLKARHELYTASHKAIADYTHDVFPQEV
ncbi:MAG: tyrosine-type recombinase/integrase [Treponema sp.]|nr:tyrosine-type recombinase/integrase [Treponema sp.]